MGGRMVGRNQARGVPVMLLARTWPHAFSTLASSPSSASRSARLRTESAALESVHALLIVDLFDEASALPYTYPFRTSSSTADAVVCTLMFFVGNSPSVTTIRGGAQSSDLYCVSNVYTSSISAPSDAAAPRSSK